MTKSFNKGDIVICPSEDRFRGSSRLMKVTYVEAYRDIPFVNCAPLHEDKSLPYLFDEIELVLNFNSKFEKFYDEQF